MTLYHSLDLAQRDLFCTPEIQNDHTGTAPEWCGQHRIRNDEAAEESNFSGRPVMIQTMETKMGQIRNKKRRIF